MGKKSITLALAGNPNTGKTSVFNELTGARQRIGNWPGVTVEKKMGTVTHKGKKIEVVDLPGTYSLTAYSTDEVVARNFLVKDKPDVVVHVIDASNLERNLYLTTQLMELGVRVVLALNMSDMVKKRGDKIDTHQLERFFETPVVETVGSKGIGMDALLDAAVTEALKGPHHEHVVGYGKSIETKITEVRKIVEKDKSLKTYPRRWLAVKILEGDEEVEKIIKKSKVNKQIRKVLETIDLEGFEAAMADKRYEAIGAAVSQCMKRKPDQMTASDMIDRVFTNKFLGIPIFLAIMWGAFELTFTFGTPFMDLIDTVFVEVGAWLVNNVQPEWVGSLLGEGIIGGVGSVIIFLPNILILFLLLAFLERSGYMARAAFIMDKLMHTMGLHGHSFVPMLMGFGCNVPAIMATRTLKDKRDRLITIIVAPFMSCGARLPVYILLAGTFFSRNSGMVIFMIYIAGIIVAILSAKLLRMTLFKGEPAPFIMELPPYRVPNLKSCVIQMWDNGKMYVKKAATIILLGVVIIWVLSVLPWGVEPGSEESVIGIIGKVIAPVFYPLGFDWKIAVALIFGFVAKEIVVGGLGVLYGVGEDEDGLSDALKNDPNFGPFHAAGLMAFTLLYMPCIACAGVIKKETGSWKWTAFAMGYGTAIAYLVAMAINGLRLLFG